jgi:hypothetical protein
MNMIVAPQLVLGIAHSFKQLNTCSFLGYTDIVMPDMIKMNTFSVE